MSKAQFLPSFTGAGPRLRQRLQVRLQRLHHRRWQEQFVPPWPDGIWSLAKVIGTENRETGYIQSAGGRGGLFSSRRAFELLSEALCLQH